MKQHRPVRRTACTRRRTIWTTCGALALGTLLSLPCVVRAEDEDHLFPCPPNLTNNVAFWKDVYARYSSHQHLLHDCNQVLVIYEVVEEPSPSRPAKKRMFKRKREHYRQLLEQVSRENLSSDEAKRIWELWGPGTTREELGKARDNIRIQTGQRDKFKEGLQRSGQYLERIRSIFREYGIPQRLAYLPHVESSFHYRAYSHRGAAGLWQFMRYTGRMFLRIDYLVDERLDPIASTVAAAKLLQQNYKRLGTWPLAITAYNHGVNGMQRAVERLGTTDLGQIIDEHQGSRFRFASKNFYAEFLAASEVATNSEKYFGNVEPDSPLEYSEVVLDRYYLPAAVCRALQIDEQTLQDYNPALRPSLFHGHRKIPKGYRLKLPRMPQADPKMLLAGIPDTAAAKKEEMPLYYRVDRGDCISTIAANHRISAQDLLEANGLGYHSKIFAGQILAIPAGRRSEPVQVARSPIRVRPPAQARPKPEAEPRIASGSPQAAIRPGENFGDSMPLPVLVSQVPDKTILAGPGRPSSSALAMNIFAPAAPPAPAKDTTAAFIEQIYDLDIQLEDGGKHGTIRVTLDETLSHYADWLRMSTGSIQRLNRMSGRRTTVSLGQKLRVAFRRRSMEEFRRIRLEYHMALEEDFYGAYRVKSTLIHTVKRGDNIWQLIDAENSPPLWLIKKFNPELQLANLVPAQEIILPEIEAIEIQ